ncbi:MAG: ABC transporter permease subunit [Gammaproteobacteria bacterium]|nr:ABC transporter permease subunit [Gammaproteobacteria bacterium]
MIFTIAARELRSLFLSPLAWVILAIVQFILTYFFLIYVEQFITLQPSFAQYTNAPGVTEIIVAPLFDTAGIILLLITPILTMRLVSEERRNRTLALLFSAPVSMTEIILGKYLGILVFNFIIILLLTMMPLSLLSGTNLDMGLLMSSFLGLVLLASSFAAIGLYMSALSSQPTIAAISTFGVLLLLWILDAASTTGGESERVISYISILRHFQPMLKGVFSSSDIIYYLLFVSTFLILSIRRLDADRLQH